MHFILQKELIGSDTDITTLKNILDRQKYMYEYDIRALGGIEASAGDIKKSVPVGTIEFVREYLQKVWGVEKQSHIEVPKALRKPCYLNREYKIIKGSEIPKTGRWFIKDASRLKGFSYSGNIEHIHIMTDKDMEVDGDFNYHVSKDQLLVLSSCIDILSEYRVMVIDGRIDGIQYYDGDCLVMPSEDNINTIKEMAGIYSSENTSPRAFTMDIAVTEGHKIALIEIHPFSSVGLYGYCGDNLPYAYRYGIEWYERYNTPLE